jgi:hypothetical protein
MTMPKNDPYLEQMDAMEDVFGAKRDAAKEDINQEAIDAWGSLAEGRGLSGSNIARVKRLVARDYATRIGGINAEERMFFANVRRAEEARKGQSTRNMLTTVGSLAGMAGAAALTLPTGGLAAGLFPMFAAGLGGVGGTLGGLLGGIATGEMEGGVAGLGVQSANAFGSMNFESELDKMLRQVRGLTEDANAEWKPYEYTGEDQG